MNSEVLKEIIDAHGKWLCNEKDGKRANLCRADLCKADLRGANLRRADLYRANLCRVNLRRACLCEADLREANLRGANLSETDLSGADLREADLWEVDLYRANLRGADLRGADLPEQIVQVGPIGSRKDCTIYWIDRDIVQCGCWNNFEGGSLDEFKKRIDDVYPDGKYRDEYLAAIAMFEALKKRKEQEDKE